MFVSAILDRLPRIRELAASEYHAEVLRGVRRLLPERSQSEHREIARGVLRHRALNRAIYRFHIRYPGVAATIARLVPVTMSADVRALLRGDRPVLVAGPHIGPSFFALTVLLNALQGRSVCVLHARMTQFSQSNAAYVQRLGIRSILHDENCLRILAHALENERRCTAVIAFDHLAQGRRVVNLFGTPLAVSYGIAYLADATDAPVVIACWEYTTFWPRLILAGPHEIDRSLGRSQRHADIMGRLFAFLETQIRRAPEQWSEWNYVIEAAKAVRLRPKATEQQLEDVAIP